MHTVQFTFKPGDKVRHVELGVVGVIEYVYITRAGNTYAQIEWLNSDRTVQAASFEENRLVIVE